MWKKVCVLIAVAVAVFVVVPRGPTREPNIPFDFIRGSSPLAVSIIWEPEVAPIAESSSFTANGPTTYVFWNNSSQSLNVIFPPVRSFGISERFLKPQGHVPKFMSEASSIVLAPGEERRFDGGSNEWSITGSPVQKFEQGPGWYGWVFDSDDQNPIGTVISKLFVVSADVTAKQVEDTLAYEKEVLSSLARPNGGKPSQAMTEKP